MRISQIDICDFRGFPGPNTYSFQFHGAQNMLIYGENGSGKSSLYRAVQEFFNLDSKAKDFAAFKNQADATLSSGKVILHFDEGSSITPVNWSFGGVRPIQDQRVANTALRLGCIDYRAMLKTNFLHQGETVNLFGLAVNHLLAHYQVPALGGRSTTIGQLWSTVVARKPKTRHKSNVGSAQTALDSFNSAFASSLPILGRKAEELLVGFPGCGFSLTLDFSGVNLDGKDYKGEELILRVHSRGNPIGAHHYFLNEAKLSGIALALYFAGLLTTIPSPVPAAPQYPRLLALDDVLIGLDMSNRIPVLDILKKHFSDWQILLFTHDKVWAEIVKMQTQDEKTWSYHELYPSEGPGGVEVPVLKPGGAGANDMLNRARAHLVANDERAAGVYARAAFELKLKRYCEKRGIPVRYNIDQRLIQANDFWTAATKHARDRAGTDPAKLATLNSLFTQIETYRKIALNPLSHSAAAAITRPEIQGAIDAVENLIFE